MFGNSVSGSASLLTSKWGKVRVPGTVRFGNPSLLNTTVTSPVSGSYTLRFNVSDGTLSTSDDVIITVAAARPCGGMVSGILAVVDNASDGGCGIQGKSDDTNIGSELTSPFSMMGIRRSLRMAVIHSIPSLEMLREIWKRKRFSTVRNL